MRKENSGTFPYFQVLDIIRHVDDKVNRPTSENITVKLAQQKANRLVSNNAKTNSNVNTWHGIRVSIIQSYISESVIVNARSQVADYRNNLKTNMGNLVFMNETWKSFII